jgi:hypothetical protein
MQHSTKHKSTNQHPSTSEFYREMGCKAQGTAQNRTPQDNTAYDSILQNTTEQNKTKQVSKKGYSLSPCEIHTKHIT